MCCLHFFAKITLVLLYLNVVCNRLTPNEKGPFEKYTISIFHQILFDDAKGIAM
jgi:hypothetical protein